MRKKFYILLFLILLPFNLLSNCDSLNNNLKLSLDELDFSDSTSTINFTKIIHSDIDNIPCLFNEISQKEDTNHINFYSRIVAETNDTNLYDLIIKLNHRDTNRTINALNIITITYLLSKNKTNKINYIPPKDVLYIFINGLNNDMVISDIESHMQRVSDIASYGIYTFVSIEDKDILKKIYTKDYFIHNIDSVILEMKEWWSKNNKLYEWNEIFKKYIKKKF